MSEGYELHWRDTGRALRFFFFDARVLAALLIWAVHMCVESLIIALLGMCFFAALELFGVSFKASLRLAKNALLGPVRRTETVYFSLRRAQW